MKLACIIYSGSEKNSSFESIINQSFTEADEGLQLTDIDERYVFLVAPDINENLSKTIQIFDKTYKK